MNRRTLTHFSIAFITVFVGILLALSLFPEDAEGGCKKHPKHCYPTTPTATVVVPTPTSTPPVETPTQTPTATATPPVVVTEEPEPEPEPEEPVDSCTFHPTNPCSEGTVTPTATPATTPEATPTSEPTAPSVPTVAPEQPGVLPTVVPPTGPTVVPGLDFVPGPPDTGSAGLKALEEGNVYLMPAPLYKWVCVFSHVTLSGNAQYFCFQVYLGR